MGCSTGNIDEQAIVEEPEVKRTEEWKQKNLYKIEDDTIRLSTELLQKNTVSAKPDEQRKVAIQPNEIMSLVGGFAVKLYNEKQKLTFKVGFFDNFKFQEQVQWMRQMSNFLNIFIRRESKGELYGIYDFTIVNDMISCKMCANKEPFIGSQIFSGAVEQQQLIEYVAKELETSVNKSNPFIEFLFDPAVVTSAQVQQLLKEMSLVMQLLNKKFSNRKFASIRKINAVSLFSFSICLFDLSNLPKILQEKFLYASDGREFQFDESILTKYGHRLLLNQLILNSDYNNLTLYIVDQVTQYATRIRVPREMCLQESFVGVISQIMFQQFDVLQQKMLTVGQKEDRYVTELLVQKADDEFKKKAEQLFEYILNQIGEPQKETVREFYSEEAQQQVQQKKQQVRKPGGVLKPGQIKQKEAPKVEVAEVLGHEDDNQEGDDEDQILQIVDEMSQAYLFNSSKVISLDLRKYDGEFIKKNMARLKKEVENRLLGNDKIVCGTTLDDEVYFKIEKADGTTSQLGELSQPNNNQAADSLENMKDDESVALKIGNLWDM
ncbi:Conserved_hypothetical protein [Hexamita inflata]|uniref:Uncharacterized protein n=1 Tax=Hexamita inflata TaxID=28002 RepID=A0AA86QA74_9EUKA|nr:Conserved hypothetical protein [Hexamita inflata]